MSSACLHLGIKSFQNDSFIIWLDLLTCKKKRSCMCALPSGGQSLWGQKHTSVNKAWRGFWKRRGHNPTLCQAEINGMLSFLPWILRLFYLDRKSHSFSELLLNHLRWLIRYHLVIGEACPFLFFLSILKCHKANSLTGSSGKLVAYDGTQGIMSCTRCV